MCGETDEFREEKGSVRGRMGRRWSTPTLPSGRELREFRPGVSTAQKQMAGETQAEAGCSQNESDTCDPNRRPGS